MHKRQSFILVLLTMLLALFTTAVGAEELISAPCADGDLSIAAEELVEDCDGAAAETTAAAATVPVSLTVSFQQTIARSELKMLNDFRTGSDAWVWDSSSSKKVYRTDLSEVTWDYDLEKVAMQRAVEIALYYAHTRPDATSCFTAYTELGYKYEGYCAENVAAGYDSLSRVFAAWQETNENYAGQGHRRIMLNTKCNRFAAACVYYNGVYYWVQEFAYTTGSSQKAGAVDGSSEETVNLALNQVYAAALTPTTSSISLCGSGSTAEMPGFETELTTTKYWSYNGGSAPVTAAITMKTADASVASVSGSSITAASAGSTTVTAVSALGATAQVSVSVAEHVWDEGTVTDPASGTVTYTCKVCGLTRTEGNQSQEEQIMMTSLQDDDEDVPVHVHDYIPVVTAATCTRGGYTTWTCSGCGDSYQDSATAALGHDYVTTIVDPTCTATGYTLHTCSRCGDSYQTDETAMLKKTGWNQIRDTWYYYNKGTAVTGWKKLSKKWYYFNASGAMLTGWQTIDGDTYCLDESGAMLQNWQTINGNKYYFGSSGVMTVDWKKISGKYYYFNNSGVMQTGWQTIDGVTYYLNASGAMAQNWQTISSKKYYFGTSGAMTVDWKKIGGKYYYFNASGVMQTGWLTVDGATYYLNASGAMLLKWQTIGGNKYYFGTSGARYTGWNRIGSKYYCFTANGVMQKNAWLTRNGKTCYVNASGVMVTGKVKINGTTYTFGSDGALKK